jgi:hypothetical protein
LNARRAKKPLKIPRNLAALMVKDRQLMRAMAVYLELKPIFYNGMFKKGRQNRSTIAEFLSMSPASYAYKLRLLIEKGFCRYDKAGNLYLCSWSDFYSLFDRPKIKRRFYYIKNEYCDTYIFLKYYAIHENFESQKKALERNIIKDHFNYGNDLAHLQQINAVIKDNSIALKDKQRRITEITFKMEQNRGTQSKHKVRKWKKWGGFAQAYREAQLRAEQSYTMHNASTQTNFRITVGCKKFAELIGLNAPSSGHYWQQKFKLAQIAIIDRAPVVFVPDANPYRDADGDKFHYFTGKKRGDIFKRPGVYRRLTNNIHLVPYFQA